MAWGYVVINPIYRQLLRSSTSSVPGFQFCSLDPDPALAYLPSKNQNRVETKCLQKSFQDMLSIYVSYIMTGNRISGDSPLL